MGKLEINGLGGSYGTERLTWYKMSARDGSARNAGLGVSRWRTIPGQAENAAFFEDIRLRRQPDPGIADAQAALRIVEQIYREERP